MQDQHANEIVNMEKATKKIVLSFVVILSHVIMEFYKKSSVVGMGGLNATNNDDAVLASLIEIGAGRFYSEEKDTFSFYSDYLFGRMMKTDFVLDPNTGKITIGYNPNPEYSSWVWANPQKQVKEFTGAALEKCIGREDVLEVVLEKVIKANS